MFLSTADPMASHFSCLRPATSCSRTARSARFFSSFWRSFVRRVARRRATPGREGLARLSRRETAFVTGSRKTVTASWSSSRSRSAFSIPFAPAEASQAGGSR